MLLLWHYLEESGLSVCPDHKTLKWIPKLIHSTGKVALGQLQLSGFAFEVGQGAGKMPQVVDDALRLKTTGTDQKLMEEEVPVLCITAFIIPKNGVSKVCICRTTTYKTTKEGIGIPVEFAIAI